MTDFFDDAFSPERGAAIALFRAHPALSSDSDLRDAVGLALEFGRSVAHLEDRLQIDRREVVAYGYRTAAMKGNWDAIQHGERVADAERNRLGLDGRRGPIS